MTELTLRAIVTVAASGVGRVYAEHLAHARCDLVMAGSRVDCLDEVGRQLRGRYQIDVEALQADLHSEEGVGRVATRLGRGSAIDMLVNSAGHGGRGRAEVDDLDALGARVRVNMLAMSRLSRSALDRMLAAGRGCVINIASFSLFMPASQRTFAVPVRSFAAAFTRHLQMEAGGSSVRAQLLLPGVVAPEFPQISNDDPLRLAPTQVIAPADLVPHL